MTKHMRILTLKRLVAKIYVFWTDVALPTGVPFKFLPNRISRYSYLGNQCTVYIHITIKNYITTRCTHLKCIKNNLQNASSEKCNVDWAI